MKVQFDLDLSADRQRSRAEINLARKVLDGIDAAMFPPTPPTIQVDADDPILVILRGTTANVRSFLRKMAQNPGQKYTAGELSLALGHGDDARAIAGTAAGLTRKQQQLQRLGKIEDLQTFYSWGLEDERMTYWMTEEQAAKVLAALQEIGK